ncbi:MAG: DivIVA domain-containing protein, partial [Oscillospiraceae bacterium]|nr:DivIVA domain-containing protein [Oscillospiraceae bacterium]
MRKGGYDMQDVDNFLDQLTADYTELYKDNAVLKRKMKVLADKITEYQETESAMRQTLLAAQKMADQIVAEAEQKRTQILAETEQIARARVTEIAQQANVEEARLAAAKKSVVDLTADIRGLLAQESEFLDNLPELEVEAAPVVVPEAETADAADALAAEIGDSIARMLAEEDA